MKTKRHSILASLLVHTAGGYALGPVSGWSLNPAGSSGISLVHCVNGGGILNAIWYSFFEIVGGAIAVGWPLHLHPQAELVE